MWKMWFYGGALTHAAMKTWPALLSVGSGDPIHWLSIASWVLGPALAELLLVVLITLAWPPQDAG
jgi:hypothetical protein